MIFYSLTSRALVWWRETDGPRISVESIKLQFATNLYGPIDVINAALPHMRALKSGTIVNVGSRSAWKTELPVRTNSFQVRTQWCSPVCCPHRELGRIRPRRLPSTVIHPCPFLPICEADADCSIALTETLTIELAQFNIKVLLVAPGAFKTEGAYNYPWDNPNPLPAYDNIRTASLEKMGSIRDAIKGDPQKAMEVVVDVVRGEGVAKGREWPTYLILGEDAEVDIRNKIGKIAKALDDWQDVIRSVNF